MPGQACTALDLVHSTCHEYAGNNPSVSINTAALERLAASIDPAVVQAAASSGNAFPIKFDGLEAEVTFLAIYHLLDFGSGFSPLLRQSGQRDAAETIQFGVLGMHLAGQRQDRHWMKDYSNYNVHSMFGIEHMVEEEVMPGVRLAKPGPLFPLVAALRDTVAAAGGALERAGVNTLGQLVLRHLDAEVAAGRQPTAGALVTELVGHVPPFADATTLEDGSSLAFHRKAQALAVALAARFCGEDERFAFRDLSHLAADSGPLVAAVLRRKGVLVYAEPLAAAVDSDSDLEPGPQEAAIRAGAVTAADRVCEALQQAAGAGSAEAGAVTPHQLGAWLRGLVEEGRELAGAQLHPHLCRRTTAY